MNDALRMLIYQALRAAFPDYVIFQVPQGVALMASDGDHWLIRVDPATLEVK